MDKCRNVSIFSVRVKTTVWFGQGGVGRIGWKRQAGSTEVGLGSEVILFLCKTAQNQNLAKNSQKFMRRAFGAHLVDFCNFLKSTAWNIYFFVLVFAPSPGPWAGAGSRPVGWLSHSAWRKDSRRTSWYHGIGTARWAGCRSCAVRTRTTPRTSRRPAETQVRIFLSCRKWVYKKKKLKMNWQINGKRVALNSRTRLSAVWVIVTVRKGVVVVLYSGWEGVRVVEGGGGSSLPGERRPRHWSLQFTVPPCVNKK